MQDVLYTYDEFPVIDGIGREKDQRYGVIGWIFGKSGFINTGYTNNRSGRNDDSVIFDLRSISVWPEKTYFDIRENVYLVRYAVDGTSVDRKTGILHPRFDYTVPLQVLKMFPRNTCIQLTIRDEGVLYRFQDSAPDDERFREAIAALKDSMTEILKMNAFIPAAQFPDLAKSSGVADYKQHASSVKAFVDRYLSAFEVKPNVVIRGTRYPGLIVNKGDSVESGDDNDTAKQKDTPALRKITEHGGGQTELDRLFDAGKYVEFLSSEAFSKRAFCSLPTAYQEKALTCAAHLLFPEGAEQIKLGLFQRELISAPTTVDFAKKWKGADRYKEEILLSYIDSSLGDLSWPNDAGVAVRAMDSICRAHPNKLNNNYPGLTARFADSYDRLLPHMYVLRIFADRTNGKIINCITEYCQIVKDMKRKPAYTNITGSGRKYYYFTELLNVIFKYIQGVSMPTNVITNIVSTYVDCSGIEELEKVMPVVDPERTATERKLLALYAQPELWQESDIAESVYTYASPQLFQKFIAVIWERYADETVLPEYFLKLLSWICIYDDHHSIDEIIRYHFRSKFTKLQKQRHLLQSYKRICEMTDTIPQMYALASYVAAATLYDIGEGRDQADAVYDLADREAFSERFYQKIRSGASEITEQNESNFVRLFSIFRFDYQHWAKLQTDYANWFCQERLPECTADGIQTVLDELFNKKAYDAYARAFVKIPADAVKGPGLNKKYIDSYVTALVQLRRYGEAVIFLKDCPAISKSERDDHLSRVMGENFRNNMLSKQAFSMFGPAFSCEEAISLLLEQVGNNPGTSLYIVNSLMALYCHRREYIKAAYLYSIFQSRGEQGYTRLYTQIRRQFKSMNINAQNHYSIVELAFFVLTDTDLIDFFQWAQRIPIPGYREYNPLHTFSVFYDQLIKQPMNEKVWGDFLAHITRRMEQNAWQIVVCEVVSKKSFTGHGLLNSRVALGAVLEHCEADKLPYNLLPYIYSYIMETNDTVPCGMLSRLLEKKEAVERLVGSNPWNDTYKKVLSELKTYILDLYRATGNKEYYNILAIFDLDMNELAWLTQRGSNKWHVFSKLCQNYLQGKDREETIDLLNNGAWSDLSYRDAEMLKLLRTIFSEDDLLLLQQPAIFRDEYDVQRVKRDCASILATYPEKDGLFAFDKDCKDTTHKLIVYSYVFSVFYSEDIYDSEEFAFQNIVLRDERTFYAFLYFLRTSYLAQLEWNVTYDFFYKKWRYLKLLIDTVITSQTDDYDDAFIISAMEKYGHYTDVFLDQYQPFREDVTAFMASAGIDAYTKKYFLAALMVGQLEPFLRDCADALACADDPALIRGIVEKLDHRDAALSFYKRFEDDIKQGRYEKALAVANSLSVFLYDAVTAMRDADIASSPNFERVYGIALQPTPSNCVGGVFWKLGPDTFMECASVLVPVVYSRQFHFQIIRRLRVWIVSNWKKTVLIDGLLSRFELFSKYFAQKGDRDTRNAYLYLSAFWLCLRNEREKAGEILSSEDVRKGVPAQWVREAERMYEYAEGKTARFIPDNTDSDSSIMQAGRQVEYTFVRSLQDRYSITKEMRAKEKPGELYEQNQNKMIPLEKRLQAGLALLYDYPGGGRGLPSKAAFLLEVGLQAFEAEIGLSADEQLQIAAELFEGNIYNDADGSGISSERFALLKDHFREVLYKNISLQGWVTHVEAIKDLLRMTGNLGDFDKLERILQSCGRLFLPECSNEELYEEYSGLLEQFKGIKSVFTENIREAIRHERARIDGAVRLRIEIVNEDRQVTDRWVYFQIVNVGRRTVSLETDKIAIMLTQDDYPREKIDITGSVSDLQKGFMTGGRAALTIEDGKENVHVSLRVESSEPYVLLSETDADLKVAECPDPFHITSNHTYNTDFAVRRSDMLFGRDKTKETLKRCISSGLAVIYGPSRIGKTSLLNWVRQYAREQGNVMTILYGGEGGLGKEDDYEKSFVPKYQEVPYHDPQEMSEYLLVHTIIQGLTTMNARLERPQKVSQDTLNSIVAALQRDDENILTRYKDINDLLGRDGLELWLLMDEFQRVVERWKDISPGCAFASVCQSLCYSGDEGHIKLIFCGSDDLLLHMVLTDDSGWRKIFPKRTRIAIEPLEEEPFHEMIQRDEGIQGANIRYSASALKALYTYTGGVALYGKEICNVVLADAIHDANKYRDRNTIYVSDIAEATQTLIKRQDQELTTEAREGIREIYDAVTKNLKNETDKQYLWYMADWLHYNPNEDGFAESNFTKRKLVHGVKTLRDSLAVATERRIIKNVQKDPGGEKVYTFCTIFYYSAFLGESRDHLNKDLIFAPEKDDAQELSNGPVEKILKLFADMDEIHQSLVVGGLATAAKDEKTRENLKQLSGTSVHINVQNITNTLTGILAPGADAQMILEGIQKLPRLSSYLPQLAAGDGAPISEERISLAMNSYVEDLREGMEGAIEQGIEPERAPNWKILNMPSEEDYINFTEQYNLSEYFLDSLQLAYQLDQLFQRGAVGDHIEEVDYSPVTIMYCKLVESLLKEYHLAVYAGCLTNLETDMKNNMQNRYKWSEVVRLPVEQQQKLTIGSFVYPLINKPWCLSKLAKDTNQDVEEWERHKDMINLVRNVRNPSAHGNKFERITAAQKNAVARMLLEEGGLLRLIRIAG